MKYISIILILLYSINIQSQDIIQESFYVGGLCLMCEDDILEVCDQFPHILEAEWQADSQELTIIYNQAKMDRADLERKLAKNGRDTENFTAPDDVYESLPFCCQYRVEENENIKSFPEAKTVSNELEGVILDGTDDKRAIPYVNVYWLENNEGTTTDENGYFSLPVPSEGKKIVVSSLGFENDTITVGDRRMIAITLSEGNIELEEVVITHKKSGVSFSLLSPIRKQEISSEELLYAACCNLSESFETNATVDATPTDAVSGTRQIKMLGLAGPYVQITRENMPDTRVLSALQGLLYTPGPWIDGIQINTGAGSVVNGYEAITGQINIEYIKPQSGNRLDIDLFQNRAGRGELNIIGSREINENWSSTLAFSGTRMKAENDQNNDGFLDNPKTDRIVLMNRHKWRSNVGWEGQVGVKYVYNKNESGQFESSITNPWLIDRTDKNLNLWSKTGFIIDNTSSFGLQLNFINQNQRNRYGNVNYNADHTNLYANFIFAKKLSEQSDISFGASYMGDILTENIIDPDEALQFDRNESVPGIFTEYSYSPKENFDIVLGIRGDYHNQFGFFVTPRVHIRYAPSDESAIRLVLGRGQRTASIFAENLALFASSREIVLRSNNNENPYGLNPETAWTTGVTYSQGINISDKMIRLELDAYRTSFTQQVVVDYDQSPQQINFYNLTGTSRAYSLQGMLSSQITDWLEMRMAYRYNDVKVQYTENYLEQPYTPKHRGFINTRLTSNNGWGLNYTWNLIGSQRLPSTLSNPENFRMPERSPSYSLSNIQISKTWNKVVDIYIGAENLFSYQQEDAIISPENPYSTYFDASIVYAPIFGRNLYAGFRWRLH